MSQRIGFKMGTNEIELMEIETSVLTNGGADSERMNRMVQYLYRDYASIYEVDIASDTYSTILQERDSDYASIPITGSYSGVFRRRFSVAAFDIDSYDVLELSEPQELKVRLTSQERYELEYETKRGSGIWKRVVFTGSDHGRNGAPGKILVTFSNISRSKKERLKNQHEIIEAFRKEQELGDVRMEFISKMSHDIRTPLNAIIGMTMIARNGIDKRDVLDDCLAKIEVASDQLLTLVNGLIDIDRAEMDKQSVANDPFDIAEIIESVNTVAEPLAKISRHELTVKTENIVHEMVSGDVQRIIRIINNLVSNSIKYTPKGGKISIVFSEVGERDDGRFDYRVVITDNGVGMSEEFLEKIYDPFSRAYDKRVSDQAGTGLGMAITNNLVNLLGGTMDIRSVMDIGTQVTVTFPLMLYRMSSVIAPAEVASKGVLVMCRQEMCDIHRCTASGRCFTRVLKEQGVPVETAMSLDAARLCIEAKKSKDSEYYCVIINAEKYTEDMGEDITRIRMAVGASVPIVLVLDRDWLAVELDARSRGVNFFLKRPVFMKSLIDILCKIHDQKIEEDSADAKKLPNCAGKRILVAEDNDVNARIITAILSTSGAVIDRVENGQLAFDTIKRMPSEWYDLVFMDIEMPIMNGYDATEAIRGIEDKDKANLPIVAMTANAFSTDVGRAKEVGMNDHLTKPIQIDRLSSILRRYLE